jgi:hypothetical protein
VVAVAAVFLILLSIRKRLPYTLAGISLLPMVTFYFASTHAIAVVGTANGTPPPPFGLVARQLITGGWLEGFLLVLIGQVVYLCQTTFCLYFAGWRLLWATALKRPREAGSLVIQFIAVTAIPIGIGAAVFISGQDPYDRPDHMLIGRYNEGTIAIVLAFALVLVYEAARDQSRRRTLGWWVGGTGAVLCLGTLVVMPFMRNVGICSINSLGNWAFIRILRTADISRVSLVVLPVAAGVLMAARLRPWMGPALVALLFLLSGVYTFTVYFSQRGFAPTQTPVRLAPILRRVGTIDDTVSYDMSHWNAFLYSTYQLLAPERFVQFRSDQRETPGSPIVIAGRQWQDAARLGYLPVDGETIYDNVLWVKSPELLKRVIGDRSFLGVEVGNVATPGILTEGLYGEECSGNDCMRWTDGHARILVPIKRQENAAKLSVSLLAFEKTPTRLLIDDKGMTTFDVGPGLVSRTIMLNPPASGRVLSIGVDSATFTPGRADSRRLGVQIRSVRVLP